MPIYAPAPPLDGTHAANAYALINGETPWSAVAVCRQQAERLAKLEAEILEECRQKQERLWHGELEEVLDQKAQEWRQRHAELESQIFYQEQRYASAQVSWRQSEVACQRDAQMRCASAQDRCLAVSEELAELRSSAATERFEFQQDVGQLHTEVLTAAKEADTMKLEERTIITCMQQELSAEAASAAHLAQQAASQRDVAISECEAVEVTLRNQRFKHRSDLDELLLQRTSLEERCQHAEHLQRLAVQRASQEEELAANASEQREVAQVELAAESEGRDELSALVIGLKSEFEAAVKEMEVERETRREFQRASQEAQKLQSTFLAEALAAREVAEAAAVEIAEERRERARDLHEFRQVLQRHQEQLSAERQRQIFSELSGIIGASAD
ncbi:ppdK [Symbiodinium pilosum]|uniref:PpdK protein n=1 Tax=Symbiodinium pilosum TaxID=2952 RepID=A0A812IRM8_SYMPI|nr:ppdK [Symbiodinium pilosum]